MSLLRSRSKLWGLVEPITILAGIATACSIAYLWLLR
jgi:hypothetical protein